jgi:hypothetical protein
VYEVATCEQVHSYMRQWSEDEVELLQLTSDCSVSNHYKASIPDCTTLTFSLFAICTIIFFIYKIKNRLVISSFFYIYYCILNFFVLNLS